MEKPIIKPPTEFYVSEVNGRYPRHKLHPKIGQAKAAITSRTHWRGILLHEEIDGIRTGRTFYSNTVLGGRIWQWVDADWELLFDIPDGTPSLRIPWRKDLKKYEFYVED